MSKNRAVWNNKVNHNIYWKVHLMTVMQLSESTEMYLKAMAEMSDHDVVAIARLAERLGVTPVSANEMVRR